jgi:hypothetical protein
MLDGIKRLLAQDYGTAALGLNQVEWLVAQAEELERLREHTNDLHRVITEAHHVVITSDRVWGGTEWVNHPMSTITRAKLRRILEGYKGETATPVPAQDDARDAERWRWLRENGKEMTYDALLEIIEEYGERADAKLDAAIIAAKGGV